MVYRDRSTDLSFYLDNLKQREKYDNNPTLLYFDLNLYRIYEMRYNLIHHDELTITCVIRESSITSTFVEKIIQLHMLSKIDDLLSCLN